MIVGGGNPSHNHTTTHKGVHTKPSTPLDNLEPEWLDIPDREMIDVYDKMVGTSMEIVPVSNRPKIYLYFDVNPEQPRMELY